MLQFLKQTLKAGFIHEQLSFDSNVKNKTSHTISCRKMFNIYSLIFIYFINCVFVHDFLKSAVFILVELKAKVSGVFALLALAVI